MRDIVVVVGYMIKVFGKIGTLAAQLRVDNVFFRMVNRIRVYGHVAHHLVEQFEIRIFSSLHLLDKIIHQVQYNCHVAVIFPQLRH